MMSPHSKLPMTLMEQEAREAPLCIQNQLKSNAPLWKALKVQIEKKKPAFALTIARGSSDHAATFAKYLLETYLGLPTVSAAPSIQTLYGRTLQLHQALVIGISQSGKSPDICEVMQQAKHQGALTVALVNQTDSPLAHLADIVIPLGAGPEKAVAATKSYLTAISALTQGVSILAEDKLLQIALPRLAERLTEALGQDWSQLLHSLNTTQDMLTLGRGFGYPIAQEAALKCKETCGIHAEAFSSAEVMHGPFALIKPHYTTLQFVQNDATLESNLMLAEKIATCSGQVLMAIPQDLALKTPHSAAIIQLPMPNSLHGVLDPMIALSAFYCALAQLAVSRGLNPDQPKNLRKVTETR